MGIQIHTRVLKEPRGFIRVIQCLMAILAFSTTAGFTTTSWFWHKCRFEPINNEKMTYTFKYPFRTEIKMPPLCVKPSPSGNNQFADFSNNMVFADSGVVLPFDFAAPAQFYVATGVLSFLYTLGILAVYIVMSELYANEPKLPVIDLAVTTVLSVFWLAGSSAWAEGVSNVKHYADPKNLFNMTEACRKDICENESAGQCTSLSVSLVFGFACFFLWASSLWFVYKETVFHTPVSAPSADPSQNQTKAEGTV